VSPRVERNQRNQRLNLRLWQRAIAGIGASAPFAPHSLASAVRSERPPELPARAVLARHEGTRMKPDSVEYLIVSAAYGQAWADAHVDRDDDTRDGMEAIADDTYARQWRDLDPAEQLTYYVQYIREQGVTFQAAFDAWLRREVTKDCAP
jgi:hypothetical protein